MCEPPHRKSILSTIKSIFPSNIGTLPCCLIYHITPYIPGDDPLIHPMIERRAKMKSVQALHEPLASGRAVEVNLPHLLSRSQALQARDCGFW